MLSVTQIPKIENTLALLCQWDPVLLNSVAYCHPGFSAFLCMCHTHTHLGTQPVPIGAEGGEAAWSIIRCTAESSGWSEELTGEFHLQTRERVWPVDLVRVVRVIWGGLHGWGWGTSLLVNRAPLVIEPFISLQTSYDLVRARFPNI